MIKQIAIRARQPLTPNSADSGSKTVFYFAGIKKTLDRVVSVEADARKRQGSWRARVSWWLVQRLAVFLLTADSHRLKIIGSQVRERRNSSEAVIASAQIFLPRGP